MFHRTGKTAWRRKALLAATVILIMAVLAACGGKSTEVATYKGGTVTDTDLNKYLNAFVVTQPGYEQVIEIPEFKELLLEQYIAYKALSADASDEVVKKAKEDTKAQMKNYKDVLASDAEFKAFVKERKLADKDMEAFLLLTTTVVGHVNSLVTEEDLQAATKELEADLAIYSVRHILVQTVERDATTGESKEVRTQEEALERAKEVKAKLEAGGDWDALAKEYSDDGGSKEKGGLYEDAQGAGWVESFKLAAYEQEIGAIGDPVESEFGYHVMLVEKREIKAYEDLNEKEQEAVKGEAAMKVMDRYMKDEVPNLDIVINLPKSSDATDEGEGEGEGEGAGEDEAGDGNAEGGEQDTDKAAE